MRSDSGFDRRSDAVRTGRLLVAGLAAMALLAACISPLPAIQWLRLPEAAQPQVPVQPVPALEREVWQLLGPVVLPAYLDREPVLVAQGAAGLRPLGELRWAEPLRDAVTRALRADLARQLGTALWTAPLPAGVAPTRQVRIELLAFDLEDEARRLQLRARWWLQDPRSGAAPRQGIVEFSLPAAAGGEAVAQAHRQALAQLAQRLAAQWAAAP